MRKPEMFYSEASLSAVPSSLLKVPRFRCKWFFIDRVNYNETWLFLYMKKTEFKNLFLYSCKFLHCRFCLVARLQVKSKVNSKDSTRTDSKFWRHLWLLLLFYLWLLLVRDHFTTEPSLFVTLCTFWPEIS